MCTVSVDSASPDNERAKKGPAWRSRDRPGRAPHTQRRFSSNEGTVAAAVANAFDHPAGAPASPTSRPRSVSAVTVETAETAA